MRATLRWRPAWTARSPATLLRHHCARRERTGPSVHVLISGNGEYSFAVLIRAFRDSLAASALWSSVARPRSAAGSLGWGRRRARRPGAGVAHRIHDLLDCVNDELRLLGLNVVPTLGRDHLPCARR